MVSFHTPPSLSLFQRSFGGRNPWPWPQMDVDKVASLLFQSDIFWLPGIGEISARSQHHGFCWDSFNTNPDPSKLLWANSLMNLQVLLWRGIETGNSGFVGKSIRLLRQYFDYINQSSSAFAKYAWTDEHAVANRLNSLLAFASYSVSNSSLGLSQAYLLQRIEEHCIWLLDDTNYVYNNHGVMMDIALVKASFFLQDLDEVFASELGSHACRRLSVMIRKTFDMDGCCTENSPAYHYVNLTLFSHVEEIVAAFGFPGADSSLLFVLSQILAKARSVGSLLLKHDGTVPTIGDSESKLGVFFDVGGSAMLNSVVQPIAKAFVHSGLFIYKSPRVYLTLRAGGCSFSHRHIDDTSITLSLVGRDMIVDAGLYSYNGNDKKRRWFTSHYAHSGFYLDDSSDIRWKNYCLPSEFASLGLNPSSAGSRVRVTAESKLSKLGTVKRQLSVAADESEINIVDSFDAIREAGWSLQFLLHPSCQVRINEDGVADICNRDMNIRISVGGFVPKTQGSFYSAGFGQCVETTMLRISGHATSACIETTILIG